jgi:hypothetical protein
VESEIALGLAGCECKPIAASADVGREAESTALGSALRMGSPLKTPTLRRIGPGQLAPQRDAIQTLGDDGTDRFKALPGQLTDPEFLQALQSLID